MIADTAKVTITDYRNMKSHMGFPLTPWLMTLDCCKVKFSWNFATFLVFWRQQQLYEWR